MPAATQVIKKTKLVNVSGQGNNCGLFALSLGARLALANSDNAIHSIPAEILKAQEDTFKGYEIATQQMGRRLRTILKAAMQADLEFKRNHYVSLVEACVTSIKTNSEASEDIENLLALELRKNFAALRAKLSEVYLSYSPLSLAQEDILPEEIDTFRNNIIGQLADFSEQNSDEKVALLFAGMEPSINSISKFIRLYQAAYASVSCSSALFNQCVQDYFEKKILFLINENKETDQYLSTICSAAILKTMAFNEKAELINSTLQQEIVFETIMELYVKATMQPRWEEIYAGYLDHVEKSGCMLSADELACLAKHWKIQLITQFSDDDVFEHEHEVNENMLTVTLINPTRIHWNVLAQEKVQPSSAVNQELEKVQESDVTPNKDVDFGSLKKTLEDISQSYTVKLQELEQVKKANTEKLADIRRFSDEKIRLHAISEQEQTIQSLEKEISESEESLKKSKERVQLLQQEFSALEEQNLTLDFDKDIDNKVDWIIKRKALQQLQAQSHAEAMQRKTPLQQATIAGRIKVEQDLEARLLSVIDVMQTEYKELEKKQEKLVAENKALHESLRAREKEYSACEKDEQSKQKSFDQCGADLNDHEAHIKKQTEEHELILNKFNLNLKTEQQSLAGLEINKNSLDKDIRSAELTIQKLSANTTMVIHIPTSVEESYRHWGGYIWGWSDRKRWVVRDIPHTVPNHAVLSQISQTQSNLNVLRANLSKVNANISSVKANIVQIQTKLAQHEASWQQNKTKLNKEKWRLQDLETKAKEKLRDSQTLKLQKAQEITSLKKSIERKEDEIVQGQKILDGKKATLEIFSKDLIACQKRIMQIKCEAETATAKYEALEDAEKTDISVATDVNAQLAQKRLEVQELLVSAESESAQLETKIIDLTNKLKISREFLHTLTHPSDQIVASKREDEELVCLKNIEISEQQIRHVQEAKAEILHNLLLGQGLVLSGYQASGNEVKNLIICLLQGIFAAYPLYRLESSANILYSPEWQSHIEKIKNKLMQSGFDVQASKLSQEAIASVVDAVNEEYQSDDIALTVSLVGIPLKTKLCVASKSVSLNLWQYEQKFDLLVPEKQLIEANASARSHRLLSALLPPHNLLRELSIKNILRDCSKPSLADCAPETLANYLREELQLDYSKHKNEKETFFTVLFKKIFSNIPVSESLSVESDAVAIQAAHYCLTALNSLQHQLSIEDQAELYKVCRKQYLGELQACIIGEIKRRGEQENNAKRLLDSTKDDLANKMQALEAEMKKQEEMMLQLAKDIAAREEDLAKRKSQTEQLKQHYAQQSLEVDGEIQKFIKEKEKIELQLQQLSQNTSASEAQAEDLKKLRGDIKEHLKKLEAQKTEVNNKLDEARKSEDALRQEKIKVDEDKAKYQELKKSSETRKIEEQEKINLLNTWREFLKNVHEFLLNDEAAFKSRNAFFDRVKSILTNNQSDTLKTAYNFLIEKFACLKDLNTTAINDCIAAAKQEKFKMLTANWSNDLFNVLQDVLSDPEIKFDGFKRLLIKGNNISWNEAVDQIKAEIIKRISYYGFNFDQNNKLILENAQLVGIINELPDRLKKLLARHVALHYQHITHINENRVVQTPRWTELEEFLTEAELTTLINKAGIDFVEVLHAYADSIEVVTGHHLYLDKDVSLPGINATFLSKDKIHCKNNLEINTSGKKLSEIQISRAKDGDIYGGGLGRDGDDGLDGEAGQCAGHIIIQAENTIENLATIKCKAHGANGLNGQLAGYGGKGFKGSDKPGAQADDTDGFGKAQFIVAQGKTPGMDGNGKFTRTNEFSGPGGNAGLAGLGGEPGLAGDIVIIDSKNTIRLLADKTTEFSGEIAEQLASAHFEREAGEQGNDAKRDAKGGEPGEAGGKGADELRNKEGFFSKTQTSHGHYPENLYWPGGYKKSDNALGINVSILGGFLGNSDKHDGESNNYHQQRRVYGHSTQVEPFSNEEQYWQDAKIDKQNRGKRGRRNDEEGRQKSPSARKCAQQSETIQNQLLQLTRLSQLATSIQNNHALIKYENAYAEEIKLYTDRTEELDQHIAHCKSEETRCDQRSTDLAAQLEQVTATIQQLDAELKQVNQLIQQNESQLNANDLAQLENMKQLAAQGMRKMEVQSELACANIDISSQHNLKARFEQLHSAMQSALQFSENTLSHDIAALQAARLLHAQRLATLQSEYANLEKSYREADAIKTNENYFNKLAAELSQLEQREESTHLRQETTVLVDAVQSDSEFGDDNLVRYEQEDANIFFVLPSLDVQNQKILGLFGQMFGTAGAYKELEKALIGSNHETIWEIALNGLRRELSKFADIAWMQKNIKEWRQLLNLCQNILKISNFSIHGLNAIYLQVQALAKYLEKIDQQQHGKCLLALTSLAECIELRAVAVLTKMASKNTEVGEQQNSRQKILQEALENALALRCENPNLRLAEQLEYKLNFFRSFEAFVTAKQNHLYGNNFGELLNYILVNTTASCERLADEKSTFKLEVKAAAEQFNINLSEDRMDCSLILARADADLNTVKKKYIYAYVILDNKLFYVAKGKVKFSADIESAALLKNFSKVANVKLEKTENSKVLIERLTVKELEKIKLLTQHEHLITANDTYYFERLQFEVEYLYAEVAFLAANTKSNADTQFVLELIKANQSRLIRLLETLNVSKDKLTLNLVNKIIKNYQLVTVLQKQIGEPVSDPVKMGELLEDLYKEICDSVKTKNITIKKSMLDFARRAVEQFINEAELSAEEWFEVIKKNKNASIFKIKKGTIFILILQKIANTHDLKLIDETYKLYQEMVCDNAQFKLETESSITSFFVEVLKNQFEASYKELAEKEKTGSNNALLSAMKMTLSHIAELWFMPHCLLAFEQRFTGLLLIKDINVSHDGLGQLQALLHEHLLLQQSLLSKDLAATYALNEEVGAQATMGESKSVKEKNKLIDDLQIIISKITATFASDKSITKGISKLKDDFVRVLSTLQLFLKANLNIISEEDLNILEAQQYQLRKYLIQNFSKLKAEDKNHAFWVAINDRLQLFESILNDHYLVLLAEHFQKSKFECQQQAFIFAADIKEIINHYNACVLNDKKNLYPSAQKHFICWLLQRIENYYLVKTDSQNQIAEIKKAIIAKDSVKEVELYLINRVNEQAVQSLAADNVFVEPAQADTEIKKLFHNLRDAVVSGKDCGVIFSAWNDLTAKALSLANKAIEVAVFMDDNAWFEKFIADSDKLFSRLVLQTEEQERILLDRESSFAILLDRCLGKLPAEKITTFRLFIQRLQLFAPRDTHYIYTERLLKNLAKENVAQQIDKNNTEVVMQAMQSANVMYKDIQHDLGESYSKAQLVARLKSIKLTHALQEAQQKNQEVKELFIDLQKKLADMPDSSDVAVIVTYLNQVDFKLIKEAELKKLFFKLKLLPSDALDAIQLFIKNLIAYQADRTTSKSSGQKYYCNQLAVYLGSFCRDKFITSNKLDKSSLMMVDYIDQSHARYPNVDVLLATYFALYQQASIDSQVLFPKAATNVLNNILSITSESSDAIFSQLRSALVESKYVWQIPCYMMVIPLLSETQFTMNDCNATIDALLILNTAAEISERDGINEIIRKKIHGEAKIKNFNAGCLSVDITQRLQLLQIMMAFKVKHFIMPNLALNHPNREIVLRSLSYIDELIATALNEKAFQAQAAKLKEIKQYYQLIVDLAGKDFNQIMVSSEKKSPEKTSLEKTSAPKNTQFFSHGSPKKNAFDVKNLLTPVEKQLAKFIELIKPKTDFNHFLIGVEPAKWESTLREIYFKNICTAFDANNKESNFGELFIDAYIAAQSNQQANVTSEMQFQNESAWLECVSYLLMAVKQEQLSLIQVCQILESVSMVGSFNHLYASINQQLPPLTFVKECLFQECAYLIEQSIEDKAQKQKVLQQLVDLKLAIFNEDAGYLLLRKLSKALLHYKDMTKGKVYPGYLQELLTLLAETKAYQQPHLIFSEGNQKDYRALNENNLLLWNYKLKREKYIQIFGLQKYNASKTIDIMVQQLSRLEKEKPAEIVCSFVEILQQYIQTFNNIFEVNKFLANFVSQKWPLDEKVLSGLKAMPVTEWCAHLDGVAAAQLSDVALKDRTANMLVEEMRKELTSINHSVKHLLQENSYIEQTIAAIHGKYETEAQYWEEANIKSWLKEFKQNAVQNFSDPVKVIEFAAILMQACWLKTKKIPRPTQLTALLMFIDAIQTDKGRLANISTGEGKSLITVMTAIVLGLQGKKVDIVTSNEVLAERDAKTSVALFEIFDLKVSNNCDNECDQNENLRKERYTNCQIMYGTTGSFQRDLLLTNFFEKPIRGQPGSATPGNALIIDEVDSMFIDNAEKILYISHSIQDLRHLNDLFLMIWAAVNSPEHAEKNEHNIAVVQKFILDRVADKSVSYPTTLKDFVERRLAVWVNSAYMAKRMEEGKEYIIPKGGAKHNKVVIMDLDTGVEQMTTQWSNGLHQFIQLKHSQKLSQESLKAVFMANAVFFQSYNGHIFGMTGTLGSDMEMSLMSDLYKIDYFRLPRNKPERYVQEPSIIVGNRAAWAQKIADELVDKQRAPGSVTDEAKQAAQQTLEGADKKLADLKTKKEQLELQLAEYQAEEKTLQVDIQLLVTQLGHDVAVTEVDATAKQRKALFAEKATKEAALKTCQETLETTQTELAELIFGVNGIVNIQDAKRNAEFIIENSGARPILIICANVKDVLALEQAILSDKYFTGKKIIILKSKDDKAPTDKLGPNDIIIATNIAGRGTDFETLDIVEKNKGLHVILSYVPPNVRIEVQGFKRTARNGNSGSGQFIVYDERLSTNPNITVDYLREIRDIEEAKRIDKIRAHGIPKLEREQKLFLKFIELQKTIRAKLEETLNNPKDFDRKAIEVQLKSLQNKWAFFLDKLEKKIADISGVSEADLLQEFDCFAKEMWHLIDTMPFRLITDPAELMRMARYCMDRDLSKDFSDETGYRLAIEYLDAIIKKEPEYAGFAHYYKAHCNFAQKKNDLHSKASARQSLKQAIDLLEARIGHLSTSAQFIRVLRSNKQELLGRGLEVDEFTRSIANEISLIQTHINAAREALGTELTAESFKSGTVTGEEHKTVFANVRQHLKGAVKSYRLSKKTLIKMVEGTNKRAIYHQDNLIELPPMSKASQELIVDKIGAASHDRTSIAPDTFKDLFITRQRFLDGLGGQRCNKQSVFSLYPDAVQKAKGKWDTGVFANCDAALSQKIKTLILSLETAITEKDLVDKLVQTGINNEKAQAIINYLVKKEIFNKNEIYLLAKPVQTKIAEYVSVIELDENIVIDLEKLNLKVFPEFRNKHTAIEALLKPGAKLSRNDLEISEVAFNLLFKLLKEHNYFKSSLLQRLDLSNVFTQSVHHHDIESELLRLYASSLSGQACELTFAEDITERSDKVWSYLRSMKVVKDPAVKFNLTGDPEDRLDDIKKEIKRSIGLLIQGKSEDDQEKYIDSIYNTLEKAVGKIKQYKDLKIDHKSLEEFLQGGKLPPELFEFTEQCYDIVLALAEDKGWSWGAFAVALIGLVQIAAGVLIGALTFGGAAFISAVLINEGIGDLVFAVQSGLSGNFSWSAYGDRKWQSLLISVATAGVGVGLSGAATAAAGSAVSTSMSALASTFVDHLVQAGISCALSLAADKLVKEVLSLVLDGLEKNFDDWVRGSASYRTAEKKLQNSIGKIYDKFGAVEGGRIIAEIIQQNSRDRHASFTNLFSAKLTETMQKLSTHLSMASKQLESSGNSTAKIIGAVSKIAGGVATATDIISKLRDIASLTSESLDTLEKTLERAYNSKSAPKAEEVLQANQSVNKEKFCADILEKQTTVIVTEIKQFIKQNLMQPGMQAVLQMGVKSLGEALNNKQAKELQSLSEKIKSSVSSITNGVDSVIDLFNMASDSNETTNEVPSTVAAAIETKDESTGVENKLSEEKVSADRKPASSFAERTQHSKTSASQVTPKADSTYDGPWRLIGGRVDADTNPWSLMNGVDADVPQQYNVWDGLACAGSILQVGGGIAAVSTGVGVPLGAVNILLGIDNTATSCGNFFTGQHRSTTLHKGLEFFGESTGLFGAEGASNAELALNLGMAAPGLIKGGIALARGTANQLGRFGLFAGTTNRLKLLSQEVGSISESIKDTLVGSSTSQMRREAQKLIANDPNHQLRFLLNENKRFFPTRGLSHAELMDNPHLIQMGHASTKASGLPERVILQGAWENQFNAATIEHASIGGYVHNAAIDIGGVAVDLRTAKFWESIGWLEEGTTALAPRLN